jgi:hypothetical protein
VSESFSDRGQTSASTPPSAFLSRIINLVLLWNMAKRCIFGSNILRSTLPLRRIALKITPNSDQNYRGMRAVLQHPYSSVTRLLKTAEWDRCLEIETIHRDVFRCESFARSCGTLGVLRINQTIQPVCGAFATRTASSSSSYGMSSQAALNINSVFSRR